MPSPQRGPSFIAGGIADSCDSFLAVGSNCLCVRAVYLLRSDPSIKIDKYSMSFAGTSLIAETTLDLIQGCRYGVVGDNGCGKSNFINSIALREVPIPDHVDMYHLDREADPTDRWEEEEKENAFCHASDQFSKQAQVRQKLRGVFAFRSAVEQVVDHVNEEVKKLEALSQSIMESSGESERSKSRLETNSAVLR